MLPKAKYPHGYLLLQIIRSYSNLSMYASMDVHTITSLEKGKEELKKYSKLMAVDLFIYN